MKKIELPFVGRATISKYALACCLCGCQTPAGGIVIIRRGKVACFSCGVPEDRAR